jgi:hypothetical protein
VDAAPHRVDKFSNVPAEKDFGKIKQQPPRGSIRFALTPSKEKAIDFLQVKHVVAHNFQPGACPNMEFQSV